MAGTLVAVGGTVVRGRLLREMEEWKAETQAELFQAIADQQARGVVDFPAAAEPGRLGTVTPLRKAAGRADGRFDG